MSTSAERHLVDFARGLTWESLPQEVQAFATLVVADALANAVAGRSADGIAKLEGVHRELYGPGTSSIIGGGQTSLVGAVGINAFQITAHTMCDVYRPALCHITPEVIPAALAVAELNGSDGATFMTAVVAGLESTCRISLAMNYESFRSRGWHSPGITGAMGASISVGMLERLDADSLAGCLGLAGSQASGSFAAIGTMGVKFHQLRGAQAAVIASTYAKSGFLGAANVLTAEDGGLLNAFSDAPETELLTRDLGDEWELLNISLRPYPAASTLQSLINCVLEPPDGQPIVAADVKHLTIVLPEEAYRLGGTARWESELRAMQSARYVAASVLITGHCWTDLYSERNRSDSRIVNFAEMIDVVCDPSLPDGSVRIKVETGSDQRELHCAVPLGDPLRPMNHDDVVAKSRRCFDGVERTSDVYSRILNIPFESSVGRLLESLRVLE